LAESAWKISIDVGGTFTDCVGVSPSGEQRYLKILSSGVTKGRVTRWTSDKSFIDSARSEVAGFWQSAILTVAGTDGRADCSRVVERFDAESGELFLRSALPPEHRSDGATYELAISGTAPVMALHRLLDVPLTGSLPNCVVHLGTTRGTNAMLTRSGARTALVTTRGFRDLLSIGDQTRPDLFALTIRKRPPLAETTLEVNERVLADGCVETAPDRNTVRQQLARLRTAGVQSLAVCLMHGYRYPEHERIIGEVAREIGFDEVCLSSQVAPLIKILARAETTVLDAYLNPVLREMLDELESVLPAGSHVRAMTSAGGLVARHRFSGKDSLLSGPAGGVVGAAWVARQAGMNWAIAFDMGGTSTDVSRFDGQFELEYESTKAGVRVLQPVMSIETVAAGGGSVCRFDGTRLVVGPESAGASPGPACYGRGGPFTVTDANLLLGRIDARRFPFPLDTTAALGQALHIRQQMMKSGFDLTVEEIAEGCLEIADHHMAGAIRTVSISRGYDPKRYPLVSFGGAAAQHCCSVAGLLGIRTILIHPRASLLSAVGMHVAEQANHQVTSIMRPLDHEVDAVLEPAFASMQQVSLRELAADVGGFDESTVEIRRSLELRYPGTEACEVIEYDPQLDLKQEFQARHQLRYGYIQDRPIEVVAARVVAVCPGGKLLPPGDADAETASEAIPRAIESIRIGGRLQQVPEYELQALSPGQSFTGPALIIDSMTTTVLLAGWTCRVGAEKCLTLYHAQQGANRELAERPSGQPAERQSATGDPGITPVDPVMLEIFNRRFVSIASQMGTVLQKTSSSVNVKERMDFSCALFTGNGELVVNAPHIPVHLGAMSETVRATIESNKDASVGDVFVTNDPYAGGSHLPDVTVVSPVFDSTEGKLIFWVASRSHHAEIGGIAPGSMPAGAKTLGEEGVLISNFRLVQSGRQHFDELERLFADGPHPSRNPTENICDVRAQVAANRCGELALQELACQYSVKVVEDYMHHIQEAAEAQVCRYLEGVGSRKFVFVDQMDSGQQIVLTISIEAGKITFDFEGTDPVAANNLNANRAIVSSAIMYVLRLIIGTEIPMNEGIMKPVNLVLRDCFLNAQPAAIRSESPPIVGGNVETSQRIVDVIFGAMGLAAASQGTMNNWLMGDHSFGYYETVGGGSGASAMGPGASAVHCHMSNTRLTDAEVLETRYPLILRECSVRAGSGGAGKHRGGDGMVRHIEFRKPLTLSLLTSRRNSRPWGVAGGEAGAAGENWLIDSNGNRTSLPWQCQVNMRPGDALRLETPGGGGWGSQTI
jgi:5-oxoprolinase (ATP-hydrolysing)